MNESNTSELDLTLSDELQARADKAQELYQKKKDQEMTAFYEVIKHGDEAHQAWLRGMIEGYFKVKIAR